MHGHVRDDYAEQPPPFGDTGAERLKQEAEGIGALVSGVVSDLQDLFRAEIALAKTELKEDAQATGKAAGMMVGGGVVGLVGFIFLMLAATYALALVLPLWASALIVAAVLIVVAAVLVMAGKKELSATKMGPEQTIETLKEDQAWAKQQINSVRK